MKNPKLIFAIVLATVFCFAGYNLWSYFQEQQAIQLEQERLAEERRIQQEKERQERAAAAELERKRKEAEELAQIEERKRKVEEQRAAREAKEKAKQEEAARKRAEQEAAKRDKMLQKARTLTHIEEFRERDIVRLNGFSPQFIRDNAEEFRTNRFDGDSFMPRSNLEKLLQGNSTSLMIYAAIAKDTTLLQVLLDIGLDINAANDKGFTPLMFASAYNTPEIIEYLIGQGADIHAKSQLLGMNALHLAAYFNPNPDVIDTLVNAGIDVNTPLEQNATAILAAASMNQNMEVVERLALRGANLDVYEPEKGLTPLGIVELRLSGGTSEMFIHLPDDIQERILLKLKNNT